MCGKKGWVQPAVSGIAQNSGQNYIIWRMGKPMVCGECAWLFQKKPHFLVPHPTSGLRQAQPPAHLVDGKPRLFVHSPLSLQVSVLCERSNLLADVEIASTGKAPSRNDTSDVLCERSNLPAGWRWLRWGKRRLAMTGNMAFQRLSMLGAGWGSLKIYCKLFLIDAMLPCGYNFRGVIRFIILSSRPMHGAKR